MSCVVGRTENLAEDQAGDVGLGQAVFLLPETLAVGSAGPLHTGNRPEERCSSQFRKPACYACQFILWYKETFTHAVCGHESALQKGTVRGAVFLASLRTLTACSRIWLAAGSHRNVIDYAIVASGCHPLRTQ